MLLLLVSTFFWFSLGSGSSSNRPDSLQSLLVHAGRALNTREYTKARDLYDAAYKLDSTNIEVLRNLAILHSTVGDHTNALKILLRAEQLSPEDPSVLNNLGTTYSVMNNSEKAAEHFQKALAVKPDNPTYLTNLALEYAKTGKMADALTTARAAAAFDTAAVEIPTIMGDCFLSQKQYDSADFYYSRSMSLGGHSTELLYLRGLARQNLKRMADAEVDFKAAIAQDSTCRDCRQAYGVVLVTKGKYEEALVQFARVVQLDSAFYPGWVSLGVMYSLTGYADQADSVLVKLMKVDSTLGYKMVDLINLESSKQKGKK
jgi:tetratricopeptide (TPR) repeat protein